MDRADTRRYLTPGEVADRYRRSTLTLFRWRRMGRGPQFVKIGGRILYAVTAVEAWERDSATASASALVGSAI